jgi:3,4-dihydroxy-2-butanone 4-phosphate synthase
MGKEKKQMCQSSCLVGLSFDCKSLKISASNVERILTCHQFVKLWQEVVNLKNEVDIIEAARLFAEEFHTPSHIFLCIENVGGLQVWNGHRTFGGSCKIGKHCSYSSMSKSFL